jgi:hypothetical protein
MIGTYLLCWNKILGCRVHMPMRLPQEEREGEQQGQFLISSCLNFDCFKIGYFKICELFIILAQKHS